MILQTTLETARQQSSVEQYQLVQRESLHEDDKQQRANET